MTMRFAYADPPYLGCGNLYPEHPSARDWDDPETHRALIQRLTKEFDGWAMSLSSVSLKAILPMCPNDCRWGPWVKPFAIFKPNVGVAYAHEFVIWRGGRKRSRDQDTVRDWVSCNITLKRGLTGAKPREFCRWIFEILNIQPGDEFIDLFPGTGAVSAAYREWMRATEKELTP